MNYCIHENVNGRSHTDDTCTYIDTRMLEHYPSYMYIPTPCHSPDGLHLCKYTAQRMEIAGQTERRYKIC